MIPKSRIKKVAVKSTIKNGGVGYVYGDLFYIVPDGVFQTPWRCVQGRLGNL